MKKTIEVTFYVNVEVDENKFTPEFMDEYRENFYQFNDIDDHMKHIAQLEARDLLMRFTEGYGPISEFGIKAETVAVTVETTEE